MDNTSQQFSEIMKVLMNLQQNITNDIKPAIEKIETRLTKNIEEVKEDILENAKKADKRFSKMEEKMRKLEEEQRRKKHQRVKANGLGQLGEKAPEETTETEERHSKSSTTAALDNFFTCPSLDWNEQVEDVLAGSLESFSISGDQGNIDELTKEKVIEKPKKEKNGRKMCLAQH